MPFVATRMDLDIIILSEVSQKDKYHDITHMWNLNYDTDELIYETKTDSQTQRTDSWLPRGRDGLGVCDQQMHTIIYRMDKQHGPTVCVCVCVCVCV